MTYPPTTNPIPMTPQPPPPNKRAPNVPRRPRTPPNRRDPYDGILLVDKPADWTSHDVVAKLRSHFRLRKVGHGGTLDPAATGLLVILLGRGTKLSERVMGTDKEYEGVMRLGVRTDTQDRDGNVIEERAWDGVTQAQVEAELTRRCGDQMQVPPMVSAVKKDGVPLYKLARKGREVEREPRLIHLYRFVCTGFEPPDVRFALKCTKGTYVRTLCDEVGEALACGAHLAQLRRTASGNMHVDQAHSLKKLCTETVEELGEHIIPIYAFAP